MTARLCAPGAEYAVTDADNHSKLHLPPVWLEILLGEEASNVPSYGFNDLVPDV